MYSKALENAFCRPAAIEGRFGTTWNVFAHATGRPDTDHDIQVHHSTATRYGNRAMNRGPRRFVNGTGSRDQIRCASPKRPSCGCARRSARSRSTPR
jgi:hypothetical protein